MVEQNRIKEVRSVGYPRVAIKAEGRPAKGTREIDGTGMYLMPGFIDLHTHTGGVQAPEAEYVYKLWMGHGPDCSASMSRIMSRRLPSGPIPNTAS